jgi:asparagine synthetase B (glutamine-hydrolysing)
LLGHAALGRHPAFYALTTDAVWFSANVLALARSGRVSGRPNRLSLALGALLYWPEAGETYFEAIRRVRPGHVLDVTAAAAREIKYWEPIPSDDEPSLSDRDALDAFEPSLQKAVRRCLDVGAEGIMLSGGVDSVVIAALAAEGRRGGPPFAAVSARTGYGLSYEDEMQSLVADALGMRHVISTTLEWIDGRDPLDLSMQTARDLPGPTNVWWVGTYTEFYRRTAAQGLTTLLTGAGGDNWLGVADAHAADLIRRADLGGLYRFFRAETGTGGGSVTRTLRRLLWSGGLRWHVDAALARTAPRAKLAYHRRRWIQRLPPWLAPDHELRSQLVERLLERRIPSLTPEGQPPRSYYLHSLRAFQNPYMHHETETAFHVESMCGLRLLSPYHDRRLVSFFNRIPPRVLMHGGRYKGLLRPIAARRLPGLGLERQRKVYSAEHQTRKLDELRTSVAAAWPRYDFEILDALGVADAPRAKAALRTDDDAGFERLARMVVLMMGEVWVRSNASI